MRKFKVVKKWPGGPGIGKVGGLKSYNGGEVCFDADGQNWYRVEQLEGFVEEVKEPEFFWYVDTTGNVVKYTSPSHVVDWLRFRTKESAEKFAKALKDTHGIEPRFVNVVAICDALNDRVK